MKTLNENESPQQYVERRIDEIFLDLAGELANVEMDMDTAAGVPMALFSKQMKLKAAWIRIVAE